MTKEEIQEKLTRAKFIEYLYHALQDRGLVSIDADGCADYESTRETLDFWTPELIEFISEALQKEAKINQTTPEKLNKELRYLFSEFDLKVIEPWGESNLEGFDYAIKSIAILLSEKYCLIEKRQTAFSELIDEKGLH